MYRILSAMINKRITFGFLIISFLGGCASPTAMLGPAYTLTSTGNVFQAGFSYGTNEVITRYTGKTPIENLKDISLSKEKNKKNIQKETLESQEFYLLVKSKIDKSRLVSLHHNS
jgi:hypothetical protein